jgi:murein DD-endopeptidase MepM/ murein hydrolase activator NlpD
MSDPYNPPRPFNRTSRYGWRIHPVTREPKFHAGEDWAAPEGTPIPAATPGKVIYSGFNPGFGNTVIVQTTNGHSLYAHMNEAPKVGVGQQVAAQIAERVPKSSAPVMPDIIRLKDACRLGRPQGFFVSPR